MFELGRELKRLFRPHGAFAAPRDGLTGGDLGLTELLDLAMLKAEAKACDVAAGRISARDRPMLQLRQAGVWREVARRTGDGEALRKAAACAEAALTGLDRRARPEAWAMARVEQAACALLAVDHGGDQGLAAAAGAALDEAVAQAPRAAEAQGLKARLVAGEALLRGEPEVAAAAVKSAFDGVELIERDARERPQRRTAALMRLARAEILAAVGGRMQDYRTLERAMSDAVRAGLALDPAYEPLSWSRAAILRGEILTAIGETTGDAAALERAVEILASVFEQLTRDHSPLDWAAAQFRLGRALAALAEAAGRPSLLEQARSAYDRALVVLKPVTTLPLRAVVAQARGATLCRQAEMLGDRLALDAAEAAFRCELAACNPETDPVAWAVCQMNLAQTYLVRLSMARQDKGERVKAAVALDAAMDVFAEHGLKALSDSAALCLERVRAKV